MRLLTNYRRLIRTFLVEISKVRTSYATLVAADTRVTFTAVGFLVDQTLPTGWLRHIDALGNLAAILAEDSTLTLPLTEPTRRSSVPGIGNTRARRYG